MDFLYVSFVYCNILFFIPQIFVFVILLCAENIKIKCVNEEFRV